MKQIKCCGTCQKFRLNNGEVQDSIFNCDLNIFKCKPMKIFEEPCSSYQEYENSQEFIIETLGY